MISERPVGAPSPGSTHNPVSYDHILDSASKSQVELGSTMYASPSSPSQPPPSMATSSARPLQLDQWANTKAPLTSSQRASVNRLAEWLHLNSPNYKQQQQQQQISTLQDAGVNGSSCRSDSIVDRSTADDGGHASTTEPCLGKSNAQLTLPDTGAPLASAQSFLAWYTQLSDSVTSSTHTAHRQALQRISDTTLTADNLLAQLEACQVNVSELRAGTAFVQDSSKGIREQAQSLLDSQTHLDTLAEDIASRLSFFTLLPYATNMLSSPDSTIVYSQSFLELMDQLDVALLYLLQEPAKSYRDAALYRMRYSQCVTRAATLAKMAVVRDLKTQADRTSDQIKQLVLTRASVDAKLTTIPAAASDPDSKGKARELSNGTPTDADRAPLSKEVDHALFDDAALQITKLRPLIFELEKRATNMALPCTPTASTAAEFESLLQECRTAWFQHRRPLLSRALLQCISEIETNDKLHSTVHLSRAGSNLVRFVVQRELNLYQQFFIGRDVNGGDASDIQARQIKELDAGLGPYLAELAETLAARLRPKLSKEDDLVVLAQTCAAIADSTHASAGHETACMRSLLPLLNEAQSRLLARAQWIITTDIANFVASEQQGDLDFPERIRTYKASARLTANNELSAAAGKPQHRRAKSGAGLLNAALSASHTASSSKTQQEKVELFTLPATQLSTYYAPIGYMLGLLYHLQALVPAPAFQRIAMAAVDACLASVAKGATALLKRKNGDSLEHEDGWLFELRQLEIVREAVVSAELVLKQASDEQARPDVIEASATGVGHAASGRGASLVDLSSLVTAINSLWTNTGRLLYPSSAGVDANLAPSKQLDMEPSSSQVGSRLQALIERLAQLWSDSIALPLRVYIDQSAAEASATKFTSTYQAFETCIESIIPAKAGKMALWIEDHEVHRLVVARVTDKVAQAYSTLYEIKPAHAGEVESVGAMSDRMQREWQQALSM